MKNKKTEILIETRERTLFRWLEKEIRAYCDGCRSESLFILPERAAVETEASVREIFRRVESGAVHFIETESRLTLVCQASLAGKEPDAPKSETVLAILTQAADNALEID